MLAVCAYSLRLSVERDDFSVLLYIPHSLVFFRHYGVSETLKADADATVQVMQ